MNLVAFPVGTTNLFPIANSSTGGQLLTEFNLKSRESVATDSSVKYIIGQSFTHSSDDFAVSLQKDNTGVVISGSVLQIAEGRAVVDGYYLESLAPINIDLLEMNQRLAKAGKDVLVGDLCIGLRMMYSTKKTLAGSLLVENNDYFEGVHVVILPEAEFITPSDSPTDEYKVTAHLLLAKFHYENGNVAESSIVQNVDKVHSISADRIGDVEKLVDSNYLSAAGLDPEKLYVLSGAKDTEVPEERRPTWQDGTTGLMIWDADHRNPVRLPAGGLSANSVTQATFRYNSVDDDVELVIPHLVNAKAYLYNSNGDRCYYPDRVIKLPKADFSKSTGGVLTKSYSDRLKLLDEKINDVYHVIGGKMIRYIPFLDADRSQLPETPIYSNMLKIQITDEIDTFNTSSLSGQVQRLEQELENFKLEFNTYLVNAEKTAQLDTIDSDLERRIKLIESELNILKNGLSVVDPSSSSLVPPSETSSDAAVIEVQGCIRNLISYVEGLQSQLNSYAFDGNRVDILYNGYMEMFRNVSTILQNYRQILDTIDSAVAERVAQADSLISAEVAEQFEQKWAQAIAPYAPRLRNGIEPGDYVIVGQDASVGYDTSGRYPSTMYVVQVGNCTGATFLGKTATITIDTYNYKDSLRIARKVLPSEYNLGGVLLNSVDVSSFDEDPSAGSAASSAVMSLLNVTSYSGMAGVDYFQICVVKYSDTLVDESGNPKITSLTSYFYTPSGNQQSGLKWSDPIWLTGGVPLATESVVGGFRNVSLDGNYGNGYVALDESGHLRLLDYELLASGVLAYQLGQDYTSPSGLDPDALQEDINNHVNYRVAFPNAVHLTSYDDPLLQQTINVTVDISNWSNYNTSQTIVIGYIDSRFGAVVHLHLVGEAAPTTVIVIRSIEKLKLDTASLQGTKNIVLENCGLCYDPSVMNDISLISGLKLWYQKYDDSDPDIVVDGMTVELLNNSGLASVQDYWSEASGGDYLFTYALKSITFASDGSIIRLGMFISDDATPNITTTFSEGTRIFAADFQSPQSLGLPYPVKWAKKQIKISGSFITAYYSRELGGYVVKDNNFTALTQKYDQATQESIKGTVSIYSKFSLVKNAIVTFNGVDATGEVIDGWGSGKFHVFYGGTID